MYNFTFKGINSAEMGVTVLVRPDIVSPTPAYEVISIDGRDSNIVKYSSKDMYDFTTTIAIESKDQVEEIQAWLQGKGKYTGSDFSDRYVEATVINEISFTRLVEDLYTAVITFTVIDPYKYSINGDEVVITSGSGSVHNKGSVDALPIIEVHKAGLTYVDINYNGNILTYTFPQGETSAVIDTRSRRASYNGKDRTIMLEIVRDYGLTLPRGEVVTLTTDSRNIKLTKINRWL